MGHGAIAMFYLGGMIDDWWLLTCLGIRFTLKTCDDLLCDRSQIFELGILQQYWGNLFMWSMFELELLIIAVFSSHSRNRYSAIESRLAGWESWDHVVFYMLGYYYLMIEKSQSGSQPWILKLTDCLNWPWKIFCHVALEFRVAQTQSAGQSMLPSIVAGEVQWYNPGAFSPRMLFPFTRCPEQLCDSWRQSGEGRVRFQIIQRWSTARDINNVNPPLACVNSTVAPTNRIVRQTSLFVFSSVTSKPSS